MMILLILLCLLVTTIASPRKSRQVAVSLSADWPTLSVSPALEASEFFAEASQESFWEFTRRITKNANDDMLSNTNSVLAHTLITARSMVPPLYHTVLEVSLDTRAFAPAVEYQRQLALSSSRSVNNACSPQFKQGNAWAVIMWPDAPSQPVAACTPSDLDINRRPTPKSTTTSQPALQLNEHDHIYPSRPLSQDIPTIYLHGLIGTLSFQRYHNKLTSLAEEGNIVYVLRHAPNRDVAVSPVTYLRGFGVTLDLKSMEYKALDDQVLGGDDDDDENDDDDEKDDEDNESGTATLSEEEEELNGIYFKTLMSRHPKLYNSLSELKEKFEQENKEGSDGEMKVWDMKHLGLQATSRIISSKDPLKYLGEISSNFPLYAKRLVSVPVDSKIIRQVQNVEKNVQTASRMRSEGGTNSVLLNGREINADSDSFNIFELLTTILSEATTSARFEELNLSNKILNAVKIASQKGPTFGSQIDDLIGLRIDTRSNSKGCIYFINNIEKDSHYKKWPKDLRSLLQPGFQLYPVKKNLYTGIFVLDPTTEQGVQALASMFKTHSMMIPLRMGIAFVSEDVHQTKFTSSDSLVSTIIRLLVYAKKKHGSTTSNRFLIELSQHSIFPMKLDHVVAAYARGLKTALGSWTDTTYVTEAQELLSESNNEFIEVADRIATYVRRKGLPVFTYFINGKKHDGLGGSSLQQELMQNVFGEQQLLGQLIHVGIIKMKSNVYGYMTGTVKKKNKQKSQQFAYSKFDKRVFDSEHAEYVPLVTPPGSKGSKGSTEASRDVLLNPNLAIRLPYLKSTDAAPAPVTSNEKKKDDKKTNTDSTELATHHKVPVTHWVIADFCNHNGQLLLQAAIKHYNQTKNIKQNAIRIAFLHHGENIKCLRDIKNNNIPSRVVDYIQESPLADIKSSLSRLLPPNVPLKSSCIITNGRLIRVSNNEQTFDSDSFALLEKYERIKLTNALYKAMTRNGQRSDDYEAIMRTNSLMSQYSNQKRIQPSIKPSKSEKYYDSVSYNYVGRSDMQAVAIIDPLSVSAQRIAPTLLMLRDVFNMSVTVFLNPSMDIQEFPIKNFYRFVPTTVVTQEYMRMKDKIKNKSKKEESPPRIVKPKGVKETTDPEQIRAARERNIDKKSNLKIKGNSNEWGSKERATTKFKKLPKQHVLTLKLVTPESWVAMKYKVEDDLDNIRLDDATMGTRTIVNAEFRLTSLLIAGNCNDLTHYKPPNGLQLVLRDTLTNNVITDTLVMQNLGYFQLRTQPGHYQIALDEGRASELYAITPKGKYSHFCFITDDHFDFNFNFMESPPPPLYLRKASPQLL
jgi:UDP-glucose:glycoprotein glucosyltransferase